MKSRQIMALIATLPVTESGYSTHSETSTIAIEKAFKEIIEARMQHCQRQLLDHVDDAVSTVSGQIAYDRTSKWHFSMPVYKALEEALEQPMSDWSKLVWQQIVRYSYDADINEHLFGYATEMLLVL